MEKAALFGVGPEAEDIIREVFELYWPTVSVESVFFNDTEWWGKQIIPNIVVERPSDIPRHSFEKLIVCGIPAYAEAVIPVLTEKIGVAKEKILPYHEWLQFHVGINKIDWEGVFRKSDLMEQLKHCSTLNDLEDFYYNQPHRKMTKYLHYFEIYDRHFKKYRNQECVVVEIGVCDGGSLQMWKNYFGSKAQIIGIDIEESTREFAEDQIAIEIGSQSDQLFWSRFKEKYPKVDILIDDGGHTMKQQIITFEEMFGHIAEDGVYICEDMHTSYWGRFGGGYQNPLSYVEYTKNFIDYINAWYITGMNEDNPYTRSMHSLHYYDSVLVIEKRKMHRSVCIET